MEEEVQEVKAKLEQTMENVLELVKRYPYTANNYALLVLLYWMEFDGLQYERTPSGFVIKARFSELAKLTSPETITRAFRKLQERGLVSADPQIRKMRRRLEEAFRRAAVQ